MGGARIMSVSCVSFLHSCHWMGVTWITKHHRYVVWPCREKEKHWTRYLSPSQAWTSHPKEGCHYGYLYHRHCPGGATYSVIAHKKRTVVQEWLHKEEIPTTLNTLRSCEESFHSLCFKERTLDQILHFRQPLDVIFPYSLKQLSSLG